MDTSLDLKILFIVFIFIIALGCGLLPYYIKSCSKNRTWLGIANAFSGGIFLAIALLHIIPEAHTHYLIYMHSDADQGHDHAPNSDVQHGAHLKLGGNAPNVHRNLHGVGGDHELLELGFPLPYFLVFCGYTFILLIDKVMFDSHALVHDHGDNKWRDSFRKSLVDPKRSSQTHSSFNQEINGKKMYEDEKNYNEFRDEDDNQTDQEVEEDVNEGIRRFLSKADRFSARIDSELSMKYRKGRKSIRNMSMKSHTGDPISNGVMAQRKEFMESENNQDDGSRGFSCDLTPYILMIALSVHSVFEGVAVGLEEDPADIWSFLIAIGTHKWAAAMSLGISMSSNVNLSPSTIKILILIFALSTPIGIVIGMIAMESSALVNIAFSSLAGGTFLYIAASEVVVEEFSVPTKKWFKLAGFIIGALLITFVTSMEEQ
ncbi:unnamed protein product [Moneuplotes crassus]|uniref:Uncharacterized protein n=2 Tax=Euplotes crassus TaxID=5936 RepID=A0AAD1UK61_EUPCR|nr:unnamed protein product [Moneuplotes crassus]